MTTMNTLWDKMVNLSPTAKIATSLIAKDAVGCVMYTSTARSNKKYSPEKRADVANYDLANGVINIGLQLLAIRPIEALMTKFSDSKLMKHFFNNLDKRLGDSDNKVVSKLLKNKSGLVKGSVAFLSVVICQYGIKRFISPYISMPISNKAKELNLISPKLYAGETYNRNNKINKDTFVMNSKLDINNQSQKNVMNDKNDNLNNLNTPMEYKKQTEQKKVLANG